MKETRRPRKPRTPKTDKFKTIDEIQSLFRKNPPYNRVVREDTGLFSVRFLHPDVSKKEIVLNTLETSERHARSFCNRMMKQENSLSHYFMFRLLTPERTVKSDNISEQTVNS